MHPGVHSVNSIKVKHYSQEKGYPNGVSLFLMLTGLEPISMQQSGDGLCVAGGWGTLEFFGDLSYDKIRSTRRGFYDQPLQQLGIY